MRCDERAKKAASLQGIGPVSASAMVTSVGDFGQFCQCPPCPPVQRLLGLVPSQNSAGQQVLTCLMLRLANDGAPGTLAKNSPFPTHLRFEEALPLTVANYIKVESLALTWGDAAGYWLVRVRQTYV